MNNPSLSVCCGIMNRFEYKHNGKLYPLLKRTFPITLEACKSYGNVSICMVDMSSDDVDLFNWSRDLCKEAGITFYYARAQRRPAYNIGYTKNMAAQLTDSEYIAFIDIDMLIPVGFFEVGIEILNKNKCAWFPYYDRECSFNGELYQGNGRGNNMVTREAWRITKWAELDSWGSEDCIFCNRLIKKGYKQVRTSPDNFIHLWHPLSDEKRDADREKHGV